MAPLDPQVQGEKLLVTYIMSRVRASAEYLHRNSTADTKSDRRSTTAKSVLTESEQPVFNRYTYYGWMYGLPAALTVFGVTFGGLRFAAYRRWLHSQSLPSSSVYHARTSASRQHYETLDQRTRTSKISVPATPSATTNLTTSVETFHIFADEVAVQVQFMVTVALSLLAGTVTSNFTYDISRFHRDLAQVPLQPGSSKLCQHMCPQLLQQREKLLSMSSLQHVYDDHFSPQILERTGVNDALATEADSFQVSTTVDEDKATLGKLPPPPLFDHMVLQLNPKNLWENPKSEDLESMAILVENCRLRILYEDECRRRNANNVEIASGMVDVPKTGVPFRYHKSSGEEK